MTPQQFIAKWQGCQLAERAFYQQHFNDLCALAGHPTPAAQDTTGDTFCFEKGATKAGGGNGWADVWKRGFFAVEYKDTAILSPSPSPASGRGWPIGRRGLPRSPRRRKGSQRTPQQLAQPARMDGLAAHTGDAG